MEKTRVGRWVGDFVQVRVLGPTGGFTTAGICHYTDEDHVLVEIGDFMCTPDTEGVIVEGGVIRIDWNDTIRDHIANTRTIIQEMINNIEATREEEEEEEDESLTVRYDEDMNAIVFEGDDDEDTVIFEGDDESLQRWWDQIKDRIDEDEEGEDYDE